MRDHAIIFLFITIIMASGCGKWMDTKGDVMERNYPAKVDNAQTREFNEKLGNINDQAGAVNAVNSFVSYVDSRLIKKDASVASFGSILGQELIVKMAEKEAAARNAEGCSVAGSGQSSGADLDIGIVTDNINELGSSEGVRVDDETVTAAKNAVEGSMPNLNPDGGQGMTPLEASVIGYAVVSGDDGTASSESVDLPANKLCEFVERITE